MAVEAVTESVAVQRVAAVAAAPAAMQRRVARAVTAEGRLTLDMAQERQRRPEAVRERAAVVRTCLRSLVRCLLPVLQVEVAALVATAEAAGLAAMAGTARWY
jgi:hypothetical protein